jgi:hypothetical protein
MEEELIFTSSNKNETEINGFFENMKNSVEEFKQNKMQINPWMKMIEQDPLFLMK